MKDMYNKSSLPKITAAIVIVILLVVLGFFGWHRMMQWHESRLESAVEKEQEKFARERKQMEDTVLDWLGKKIEREKPGEISEERMREVFGEPVFSEQFRERTPASACGRLERKITSFFSYLDRKRGADGGDNPEEKSTEEIFETAVSDLAGHPPLITGETRDLVSLMRNRAHFFRILGKERIALIVDILRSEEDVLEPAMADFYRYYVRESCCGPDSRKCIPDKILYEYAGFFLDTLSGRSYLMRRHPVLRTLVRYYSILILDRANEKGINRHGIDIRPHIELVLSEVKVQGGLLYQQRYVRRLVELEKDYGMR